MIPSCSRMNRRFVPSCAFVTKTGLDKPLTTRTNSLLAPLEAGLNISKLVSTTNEKDSFLMSVLLQLNVDPRSSAFILRRVGFIPQCEQHCSYSDVRREGDSFH